jgi:ABC-type glycerol-3-phosphate transport system substrate-binding protein
MRTTTKSILLGITLMAATVLTGCGGGGDSAGSGATPAAQTPPASVTVISGKA